nr:transposase [Vitiosangium sp. GDMCC 1.1324]
MSFIQFFGSAHQVTPHFHSLVPDGVFVPGEGGARFEALPPPTQGEVERLLMGVRHRVLRLLEKRGALTGRGWSGCAAMPGQTSPTPPWTWRNTRAPRAWRRPTTPPCAPHPSCSSPAPR